MTTLSVADGIPGPTELEVGLIYIEALPPPLGTEETGKEARRGTALQTHQGSFRVCLGLLPNANLLLAPRH